jgi:3,4-dihydroxy-2-butanone 4-phosphate synthase
MDISGAGSVMAQASMKQNETQNKTEAQVSLLKDAQEQPAQVATELVNSVSQPEGGKGQNLDLMA